MRNLAAVLFLAVAACGGGSDTPPDSTTPTPDTPVPPDTNPPPPDAQTLDLSCANNPAPTTAPQSVNAAGVANSLDISFAGGTPSPDIQALDEADVDVCTGDCQNNNLLASTTSATAPCDAAGCAFTVAADTGGTPLNAYLKVARQDVITSNIFPSEPIATDIADVPAIALKPNALTLLSVLGQTQNKGQGLLIVRVSDCALVGPQGAALSVTPAGDAPFDLGALDATLAGTFLVLNVPPGTVTVGATVDGTTYRAHDVVSFADELSATQVLPGFAAP